MRMHDGSLQKNILNINSENKLVSTESIIGGIEGGGRGDGEN